MTYEIVSAPPHSPHQADIAYPTLLIDAARCWRRARNNGGPIQPHLALLLSSYESAILAPVLDSLMRSYERALGRSIVTGQEAGLSDDEYLLIALFDGAQGGSACLKCPENRAETLRCALCSARVMLALEQMARSEYVH